MRRPRRPAAEVRPGRVRRARHDLLRPAQGHHPPQDLRQGPRDRRQVPARHEGAGSLLRRHSADDARTAPSSSTAPSASSSRSCTVRPASSSRPRTTAPTSSARSFRTAAAGWSSSTTRRTRSTSASTASASSSAPSSCARSACVPTRRSSRPSTPSTRINVADGKLHWKVTPKAKPTHLQGTRPRTPSPPRVRRSPLHRKISAALPQATARRTRSTQSKSRPPSSTAP